MARTTEDLLATLPPNRRAKVEARAQEMIAEVDGLAAVRKLAGKTQAQIAASLGKKQPSVQKMEKQTDLYVSTLRRFVEAAGGTVEIRISLPGMAPVALAGFEELRDPAEVSPNV
ncbi:XRE family transcriptional regulator [Phenylobacterium sp.]|jgi:transcriptional regulator with XRE-family HTH domain|uniref:XRE family transcriptional regulator n=1 Tax=Phenylobacterium sp. TaxID=1871053 RepID=UPI000BDD359E|nr:XRE family transcriptional regulator [Phenylobacterium sp.]MDP1873169.1 XRE family transcriptional regulator [Phenylobacterium sp.]OYW91370.1 MAG: XRE family transcriptional regulator [Caulobacterales bacterium 32-67-6]